MATRKDKLGRVLRKGSPIRKVIIFMFMHILIHWEKEDMYMLKI